MKIDLYFAAGSCAFAPLVALEEAGLAYGAHRLDLAAGQQKGDAFRSINPHGRVPLLVVDGWPISENIAVLTTIARLAPQARLLPEGDVLALGRAYELMSWFASSVHVTIAQLWRSERFTADVGAQRALQDAAPTILLDHFADLESRLTGAWLLGAEYSAVDAYAAVFYRWAAGRLGIDVSRFPRWSAHMAAMLARPAVQRALAIEQDPVLSGSRAIA